MPEFPFEITQGQLDAQLAVLVALLALALFFLLAPGPRRQGRPGRPQAPTQDTTKTWRLP